MTRLSEGGRLVTVLTIAGSDPSGGAGLQADLQVFASLGVHGAAAVTALTVQDTLGVHGYRPCPAEWVRRQIEVVAADLALGAVKVGMLGTAEVVEAVSEELARYRGLPLVVDPVLHAGSGAALLAEAGLRALRTQLLPLATLVTPNLPEAEALTGAPVRTLDEMRQAARALSELGPQAVLVKGGHLAGEPVDVLWTGGESVDLTGERVLLPRRVHGTGCAFAAASASFLASGADVRGAVARAKGYVTAGLRAANAVGKGALVMDFAAAGRAVAEDAPPAGAGGSVRERGGRDVL